METNLEEIPGSSAELCRNNDVTSATEGWMKICGNGENAVGEEGVAVDGNTNVDESSEHSVFVWEGKYHFYTEISTLHNQCLKESLCGFFQRILNRNKNFLCLKDWIGVHTFITRHIHFPDNWQAIP
ncbi:hypothetical protein ACJX0J_017556 [Zea mays]